MDNFFYNLNKKMADLAQRQDLAESAVAERDMGKHNNATTGFKALAKKAGAKYGSKAAGERVAGAQFQKMKKAGQLEEGHCSACDCAPCQCNEGTAFSKAVVDAKRDGIQPGEKINVGGKTYPVKETDAKKIAPPQRNQDAMAGKQDLKQPGKEHPFKNIPAGIKTFVQGKPEPMGEEKTQEPRSKGTAFDPDYQAQAKKEKEGTGNFDKKKISTGTVYTRKHKDDEEDEVKSDQPKTKGRPKGSGRKIGAKGPSGKSKLLSMKENDIAIADRGEYDDEVGQTKDSLHTIVRHAKELESALRGNENMPEWVQEKIGQIKGMMTSVTDYILSTHEREPEQSMGREVISMVPEKAPPGARAERMVKGIKKSLSKDGHLSDKDKAIAYATTWKAKKDGKVEEQGAKPDFLDMDKDGDKKEPMKKAVADKKEKKVAETTTSGSVATAPETKKSSGSMQFGKGVYEGAIAESYQKKLNTVLAEAMNVTVTMNNQTDGGPNKTINVSADGEDAEKLAEILKLAGLGGLGGQSGGCSSCGQSSCGCETMDEAYGDATATNNSPDWPTDTETIDGDDPYLRRFSGGLNGAKSTGQTTIPVIASQIRRTSTMEENVELERSLFNTWKNYKG